MTDPTRTDSETVAVTIERDGHLMRYERQPDGWAWKMTRLRWPADEHGPARDMDLSLADPTAFTMDARDVIYQTTLAVLDVEEPPVLTYQTTETQP